MEVTRSGFVADGTGAAGAGVAVDGSNGGDLTGGELGSWGGRSEAEGGDEEGKSVHVD